MDNIERIDTNVLVIGSGAAGSRAAISAANAGADVVLVTKGKFGSSGCTAIATSQWMAYSAAFGHADSRDNPHIHFEESVRRGGYVLNQNLMKIIAEEAPSRLLELEEWGARFDKIGDKFKQTITAYSDYPRACGARITEVSREILSCLVSQVRKRSILIKEDTVVVSLVRHNDEIIGAIGIDVESFKICVFKAKATVLATGGAGQLYARNVFHRDVNGDGLALAYRVGAQCVNLEFIQMFPFPVFPMPFPPSLWKLNPKLFNSHGEEFVEKYLPQDVSLRKCFEQKSINRPFSSEKDAKFVDIAIVKEIEAGRSTGNLGIYFDLTHNSPDTIEKKLALWFRRLLSCGIMNVLDLRNSPIEITYTIQHFNGGILINEQGETTVPRLYAAGEVAGGQHGADRLGGNALADCLVFGARAGISAASMDDLTYGEISKNLVQVERDRVLVFGNQDEAIEIHKIRDEITKLMLFNVSAIRTSAALRKTIERLQNIRIDVLPRLRPNNRRDSFDILDIGCFCDVGEMIARSALCREESRGPHYREDYPVRDDSNWIKMVSVNKENEEMKVRTVAPIMIVHPD